VALENPAPPAVMRELGGDVVCADAGVDDHRDVTGGLFDGAQACVSVGASGEPGDADRFRD